MKPEPTRMMLGFVVRDCAVALGHEPTPDELARWANEQCDARGPYRIFGRPISAGEAAVILRNPDRLVAVRAPKKHVSAPSANRSKPGGGVVIPFARRREARP